MGKELSFNNVEYDLFMGEISRVNVRGRVTKNAIQDIMKRYIEYAENNPSPREIHFTFKGVNSYDSFASRLARVLSGNSFDRDYLEKVIREISQNHPGLEIAGLAPIHPVESLESKAEDSTSKKRELSQTQLEQFVREEMNPIYLHGEGEVNLERFPVQGRAQKAARDYFLGLLTGDCKSSEPEASAVASWTIQKTTERALVAYMGFYPEREGFLLKNPDQEVAEMLIGKMGQSHYTNVQMFRRVALVLIGNKLMTMQGDTRSKNIIGSDNPRHFKDGETVDYINNSLKELVREEARRIHGIPTE